MIKNLQTFYLFNKTLQIRLLDSNITMNEKIGEVEIDVNDIKVGDVTKKTFKFMNVCFSFKH